jgi:hypothetical protein
MPTVAQIENADALTASQALRLIARIRASDRYRDNRAAYPDLETTIKAKINRRVPITGATNAAPVVITAAGHGFKDGDLVTVQGVGGNESANGVWVVANAAENTFELRGSAGIDVYTSGGEVVDLQSQHLAAITDLLRDGTVGVNGGRDGVDFSLSRDREDLIAEALDLIYSAEDSGAIVAVGQRGTSPCVRCGCWPCRCGRCHGFLWEF